MRRLYGLSRWWDLTAAVGCLALFAAALIWNVDGPVWALPLAALWWFALARYSAGKHRAAERHRELRARRLEREQAGLAPRRDQ
jgi:hypothetical protein